jgi:hypothetical protein
MQVLAATHASCTLATLRALQNALANEAIVEECLVVDADGIWHVLRNCA